MMSDITIEKDTKSELTNDKEHEASELAYNLARCGNVESIIALLGNAYGEGVKQGYKMAGITPVNQAG